MLPTYQEKKRSCNFHIFYSIDHCLRSEYDIVYPNGTLTAVWDPANFSDMPITIPCPCGNINDIDDTNVEADRLCTESRMWDDPNVASCQNLSFELCSISLVCRFIFTLHASPSCPSLPPPPPSFPHPPPPSHTPSFHTAPRACIDMVAFTQLKTSPLCCLSYLQVSCPGNSWNS